MISPTLLILHSDSGSLETTAKNGICGIRNNGQPSALWGTRSGLRLLSRAGEKSNVIWFHHNCLSSLGEN